jgi:hypothetical protein
MRHLIPISLASITLLLAGCNNPPEMDEQMKQDLEAASTAGIELAPNAPATKVVSAIESKQPTQPRVTPVRRANAPAKTPPPQTPQVTQSSSNEPTATRPATRPAVQPPPPGGYKTVGEVIRNAPFPIKP